MLSNSISTMPGGTGKSYRSASLSSSARFSRRRDAAVVIALHLLPHLLAQLGEAFEPDRLGQLVVDRRPAGGARTSFTATSNTASLPAISGPP